MPKGSNSGVKLHGHYEIQIADSWGHDKPTASDCGGIYPRAELLPKYHHIDDGYPPRVNATKTPGEWQTLDIASRPPVRHRGEEDRQCPLCPRGAQRPASARESGVDLPDRARLAQPRGRQRSNPPPGRPRSRRLPQYPRPTAPGGGESGPTQVRDAQGHQQVVPESERRGLHQATSRASRAKYTPGGRRS